MTHPILIVPCDERWPGEFRRIGEALRAALGDLALRIDHIGSTAVPGLPAKDVIDVQVTVRSLDRGGTHFGGIRAARGCRSRSRPARSDRRSGRVAKALRPAITRSPPYPRPHPAGGPRQRALRSALPRLPARQPGRGRRLCPGQGGARPVAPGRPRRLLRGEGSRLRPHHRRRRTLGARHGLHPRLLRSVIDEPRDRRLHKSQGAVRDRPALTAKAQQARGSYLLAHDD